MGIVDLEEVGGDAGAGADADEGDVRSERGRRRTRRRGSWQAERGRSVRSAASAPAVVREKEDGLATEDGMVGGPKRAFTWAVSGGR